MPPPPKFAGAYRPTSACTEARVFVLCASPQFMALFGLPILRFPQPSIAWRKGDATSWLRHSLAAYQAYPHIGIH